MGRRRMRAPAIGALLVALLTPAIAEAQLFPNLPTRKRQRIDCSQELPLYGTYRHKYYGYFPTCWRKFPPGWGCPCPSSEEPDWQASLARRPVELPDEDFGLGGLPGDDGFDPFDEPGREESVPPLPGEGSPFDMDLDGPSGVRSPFEMDEPEPGFDRRPGLDSPFDMDDREPGFDRRPGIRSPFDMDEPEPGPERPGVESPSDRIRSPFDADIPGISGPSEIPSPRADRPSEARTQTGARSGRELVVLPDVRSRPVGPRTVVPPDPIMIGGAGVPPEMIVGDAGRFVGPNGEIIVAEPGVAPGPIAGGMPGRIIDGPVGVPVAPPIEQAEPRPIRRILSGVLFGHGLRR